MKIFEERVSYAEIIHSTSTMSASAKTENKSFANTQVYLNTIAIINKHSVIKTGCVIEDFLNAGSKVVLAGNVHKV